MFQNQKIGVEFVLPPQKKGSSNDSYANADFETQPAAEAYFEKVKERLLTVSRWSSYAGGKSFIFELTDAEGNLKSDPPAVHDKVRIQLPGPKDEEGHGYDWVEVLRMEEGTKENIRFFVLEVSPCDCPYQNGEKTAHFYWENATNSFVIAIENNTVQVSIHGRNELANTEKQSITDKIRNFLVAHTGILGGSKIQWEVFTDNLMKEHNGQV